MQTRISLKNTFNKKKIVTHFPLEMYSHFNSFHILIANEWQTFDLNPFKSLGFILSIRKENFLGKRIFSVSNKICVKRRKKIVFKLLSVSYDNILRWILMEFRSNAYVLSLKYSSSILSLLFQRAQNVFSYVKLNPLPSFKPFCFAN